jgi:hypothetical protein
MVINIDASLQPNKTGFIHISMPDRQFIRARFTWANCDAARPTIVPAHAEEGGDPVESGCLLGGVSVPERLQSEDRRPGLAATNGAMKYNLKTSGDQQRGTSAPTRNSSGATK